MTIHLNAELDAALLVRVDAHERRRQGVMSIHEYIVALEWVRWRENTLEPIRRAAGYGQSRALETCTARTDYRWP